MVPYEFTTVLCDGAPYQVAFAVEGDRLRVHVNELSRTVTLRGFSAQELAQIVAVELLKQRTDPPPHGRT
jgi:hypothetical protein